MKELFKKLLKSGDISAFDSQDKMKKAAYELGYTEEQVENALNEFSGFPLDDDDLDAIAGGRPSPSCKNQETRLGYDGKDITRKTWDNN